ncbi:MAG: hypothetical protein LUQ11_04265 [Methylococcaceae bacterium]|nr:hypothetical protein [Methylococcaceae bacterium]
MYFDKESNESGMLEDEFEPSLRQSLGVDRQMPSPDASAQHSSLVGEVIDTHNPDHKAHVFVRWLSGEGEVCESWLKCVRGTQPRRGDRVLIEQPVNWPHGLVTAVIEGLPADRQFEEIGDASRRLELEPGQSLRITDFENNPLLDIYTSSQGPVVRLLNEDIDIEVAGKLRFKASTIELEAGRGGVDIRTEADTVVRSRYIRLN